MRKKVGMIFFLSNSVFMSAMFMPEITHLPKFVAANIRKVHQTKRKHSDVIMKEFEKCMSQAGNDDHKKLECTDYIANFLIMIQKK